MLTDAERSAVVTFVRLYGGSGVTPDYAAVARQLATSRATKADVRVASVLPDACCRQFAS